MAGQFDAGVTQLSPVPAGGTITLDHIGPPGTPFEALLEVVIGSALSGLFVTYSAYVWVQNLSTLTIVGSNSAINVPRTPPPPPPQQVLETVRLPLTPSTPTGAWGVPGEVLRLVGSYVLVGGTNADYSIAFSEPFIVTTS